MTVRKSSVKENKKSVKVDEKPKEVYEEIEFIKLKKSSVNYEINWTYIKSSFKFNLNLLKEKFIIYNKNIPRIKSWKEFRIIYGLENIWNKYCIWFNNKFNDTHFLANKELEIPYEDEETLPELKNPEIFESDK